VTDEEYGRVERLIRAGAARSIATLVRLAVGEYTRKAGVSKLMTLREVPISEARKAVERYLKTHSGVVWPDEMAEDLGIDYRIVLAVVRQLLEEGRAEETALKVDETRA
jgi:hypothetical protein